MYISYELQKHFCEFVKNYKALRMNNYTLSHLKCYFMPFSCTNITFQHANAYDALRMCATLDWPTKWLNRNFRNFIL